jgi:hypothetical protein
MLAFAAAARAEVLAPRRNFDERIRTRVAFEVEERGLVGLVPLSRRAWRESGTAATRRNANTDELGGTR